MKMPGFSPYLRVFFRTQCAQFPPHFQPGLRPWPIGWNLDQCRLSTVYSSQCAVNEGAGGTERSRPQKIREELQVRMRWTISSHPETWGLLSIPFSPWFEGRDCEKADFKEGWAEERRISQLFSTPESQRHSGEGRKSEPQQSQWQWQENHTQARQECWCSSPLSQNELISHQINQLEPVVEAAHTSVGSGRAAHLSALKWHHVNSQADAKLDENSWFTQCLLDIHS